MDEHFRTASNDRNMPVIMALLGIWYNNFLGSAVARDSSLRSVYVPFAAYFQQGDMESNGKYIDKGGKAVGYETGPIIWGEPGTTVSMLFTNYCTRGRNWFPVIL